MLDFTGSTTVYLACGATDLRKSYNSLAALSKLKFHLDPYSRCMFAFCNHTQTHIHQDSPVGRDKILDPDETARPGIFSLACHVW